MIDREQVLHVARLARLELSDDEVARMATELSTILGHVDRMSEIELEGVPPTTHVVEVTGALRADEPRPSWPRETMLEQAPAEKDGGFLVPSPQAG
jgi:aspartyl-tRNA(Asn)/glutamyl-tRNA(Gln) amidotransferase subunit C